MSDFPAGSADAAGEAVLSHTTTYYLSLHTADPGTTGANEVTGGSYARQAITVAAWSGGSTSSTDAQSFTGMPSVSGDLWIGVWSASTAGTFVWGDPNSAVTGPVAAGATVSFAIGAVTASLS